MSHIEWSDNLDTGIAEIDRQHHRIVEYINRIDDINSSESRHKVSYVLQELVDYIITHFAFEEDLMEQAGYMFLNGHKKVHDMFARRVNYFMLRCRKGEDIAEELLDTLRTWLIYHIKTDDSDYVDVVKNSMRQDFSINDDSWLTRSVRKFFG